LLERELNERDVDRASDLSPDNLSELRNIAAPVAVLPDQCRGPA
jgi:hypothetical protein